MAMWSHFDADRMTRIQIESEWTGSLVGHGAHYCGILLRTVARKWRCDRPACAPTTKSQPDRHPNLRQLRISSCRPVCHGQYPLAFYHGGLRVVGEHECSPAVQLVQQRHSVNPPPCKRPCSLDALESPNNNQLLKSLDHCGFGKDEPGFCAKVSGHHRLGDRSLGLLNWDATKFQSYFRPLSSHNLSPF